MGVWSTRHPSESQRRGLCQIACDDADVAGFEPLQKPFKTVDVHRLVEAIGDGLTYQGMIRDLTRPDQIRSSAAIRASCGGTFLPPRNRGSASDTPATQRQRVMNIGASSSASVSNRLMLAECR